MKFSSPIVETALWHSVIVHAESLAKVIQTHILLSVVISWKGRILV